MAKNCIIKRLYATFTPYVQFAGWLAVLIPACVTMYVLAEKAAAFDGRITALERAQQSTASSLERIDEKADLIIEFLRVK